MTTMPTAKKTVQRVAPVLPVRDVELAIEHYRKLGFEAQVYSEKSADGGAIYGFVTHGDVELHLSLFAELNPKTNTSACYLYVDDANALHEAWSKAGVAGRFTEPVAMPYGLREFVHCDRDNNLLRVGSELPKKT